MTDWFQQSREDALERLGVEAKEGLSHTKAAARLTRYGLNRPDYRRSVGLKELLDDQLTTIAAIILCVSAGLLVFDDTTTFPNVSVLENSLFGEPFLALVLFAAIMLVGVIRVLYINGRLSKLRSFSSEHAKVRRGGKITTISATDIVPGDIVVLQSGQRVPADVRLIMARGLTINETTISGAAMPVTKNVFTIADALLLEDHKNMAFAGSFIEAGRGEGVVVATGKRTELGKIMHASHSRREGETPAQKKLLKHSRNLRLPLLLVYTLVLVLAVMRAPDGYQILRVVEAALLSAALVIAIKPASVSSLVLIGLLNTVRRLSKKGLILRRAAGFEGLSSVDVICVDNVDKKDTNDIHRLQSESGVRVVVFASSKRAAEAVLALNSGIDGDILTPPELHHMSAQLLKKNVRIVSVYFTDSSVLKLRIVHALKSNGHRVAVIGASSSDITSMKVASVAAAAGDVDADVSAATDLLLPARNLASIHEAILESRHAALNLRLLLSFMSYYGVVLALIIIGSLILTDSPFLSAAQLLLVGLICSVLAPTLLYKGIKQANITRMKPADFK